MTVFVDSVVWIRVVLYVNNAGYKTVCIVHNERHEWAAELGTVRSAEIRQECGPPARTACLTGFIFILCMLGGSLHCS